VLIRSSCGLLLLGAVLAPLYVARGQQAVAAKAETNAPDSPLPGNAGDANALSVPGARRNWTSQLVRDFLGDQVAIWSSPKDLRLSDTSWLFPYAGLTAGLFVTDTDFSRHEVSTNPKTLSHYSSISNYAVFGLAGGAGAMWLLSYGNHNAQWHETGFLAGEAAADSLVMTEAFKYAFRRERPFQNNGNGSFFQSGGDSFPSEHSAAAWSIASVVAHEYPGPLTKILAYGAASLVSYSRVKAHQHFPSDVMVGALIGELSAYKVYSRHHDPELGGDVWNGPASFFYEGGQSKPGFVGSAYVPLDSWIYPMLDRLAAMGLVDTAFVGMRPWTRLACAQMISEAQDRADAFGPEANSLVSALQKEFSPELGGGAERGETIARLESVYFRGENISGPALTDGYHFAQTQINDLGRPYGQGWNSITGFSAYSTTGPWNVYVRGEMQTAPAVPALPLAARQFAGNVDGVPAAAGTPTPSVQRFHLIEGYAGLTMSDWQFSFGRQSLDWGPGEGGSLMFSENATPIDMFRINRVSPLQIPLASRFLGPMRLEVFFGRLTGQQYFGEPDGSVKGSPDAGLEKQPFLYGGHFAFKPTRNFEFGFSETTIMGGPGEALTLGAFKHSVFGLGSNGLPGSSQDPGDRRSGMDWNYRLPLLRNWVTFYGDAFADDQYSPIAYWDRSAIRGGLYFSHVPKVQKLDFRVEGVYTDVPAGGKICCGFFYFNDRFRNGYTNDGFLLGSWIGRDGQGTQAWTNYWFTSKNRLQFYFRHEKVSQQFVPGGGTLTEVGTRADYWFRQGIGVSASVQYEKWLFPIIQPGPQINVATSIGIQFQPQRVWKPSLHGVRGSYAEPGGSH
jgi:membrane-associated phospholipid phosphatase